MSFNIDIAKAQVPAGYNDVCSVCLDQVEGGDVVATKCHHLFHKQCIETWGQKSQTCPNCRSDISKRDITAIGKKVAMVVGATILISRFPMLEKLATLLIVTCATIDIISYELGEDGILAAS